MRFNRYIALALTFVAGASSVLGAPRLPDEKRDVSTVTASKNIIARDIAGAVIARSSPPPPYTPRPPTPPPPYTPRPNPRPLTPIPEEKKHRKNRRDVEEIVAMLLARSSPPPPYTPRPPTPPPPYTPRPNPRPLTPIPEERKYRKNRRDVEEVVEALLVRSSPPPPYTPRPPTPPPPYTPRPNPRPLTPIPEERKHRKSRRDMEEIAEALLGRSSPPPPYTPRPPTPPPPYTPRPNPRPLTPIPEERKHRKNRRELEDVVEALLARSSPPPPYTPRPPTPPPPYSPRPNPRPLTPIPEERKNRKNRRDMEDVVEALLARSSPPPPYTPRPPTPPPPYTPRPNPRPLTPIPEEKKHRKNKRNMEEVVEALLARSSPPPPYTPRPPTPPPPYTPRPNPRPLTPIPEERKHRGRN